MRWTVAAPFFTGDPTRDAWIDDAASGGPFRKVAPPRPGGDRWHDRASRGTPLALWRRHWGQAGAALTATDGLVTVFPQLALAAAARRRFGRRRVPLVAWCFNIGAFPTGAKGAAARAVLRGIERIVVHSTGEVAIVRDWLGVDEGVVQFVPLQRAPMPALAGEDRAEPFALAMGSANRDYPTLFAAARVSGLPVTVVAAPRAVEGLAVPANVTLLSGLPAEECWRLAQRARFSIVPLADVGAASGQVTVIEAMRMNRPVLATRSIGTADYVEDGRTGLLVPPADPAALAAAMRRLWDDAPLRETLVAGAAGFAAHALSDEAAAAALVRICAEAAALRR